MGATQGLPYRKRGGAGGMDVVLEATRLEPVHFSCAVGIMWSPAYEAGRQMGE